MRQTPTVTPLFISTSILNELLLTLNIADTIWNGLVVTQLHVVLLVCVQCFFLSLKRRFVCPWPKRIDSTFVNDPILTAALDVFNPDQPPGQIGPTYPNQRWTLDAILLIER